MLKLNCSRWEQRIDVLRDQALSAEHPRTRERWMALYEICMGIVHNIYLSRSNKKWDAPRPNDIDGCFDGMGIDSSALDPVFQDLDEQHARFGCELRMDFMSAFQGFLQKNRNGEAIGIVEIDLRSFDITR
jgi:hypothetical protein